MNVEIGPRLIREHQYKGHIFRFFSSQKKAFAIVGKIFSFGGSKYNMETRELSPSAGCDLSIEIEPLGQS